MLVSVLIKIQPDATVCRYLFTAESLYMFWVSQHPSSGVLKTLTAASGTGHNTGTATSLQRDLIGTLNYDARNHELKKMLVCYWSQGFNINSASSSHVCVWISEYFNDNKFTYKGCGDYLVNM
jgi:hypothetical protein